MGKVRDTKNLPLYTEEVGSCLVVLIRGTQSGESQATITSLNHIFADSKTFEPTLKEIANKVQKGTLEFFIAGGMKITEEYVNTVKNTIELYKAIYHEIAFEIRDNTYGQCELGKMYIRVKNAFLVASYGLKYVGFDEQSQPYQIIDVCCENVLDEDEDLETCYIDLNTIKKEAVKWV